MCAGCLRYILFVNTYQLPFSLDFLPFRLARLQVLCQRSASQSLISLTHGSSVGCDRQDSRCKQHAFSLSLHTSVNTNTFCLCEQQHGPSPSINRSLESPPPPPHTHTGVAPRYRARRCLVPSHRRRGLHGRSTTELPTHLPNAVRVCVGRK
jgi:hypothetical protein